MAAWRRRWADMVKALIAVLFAAALTSCSKPPEDNGPARDITVATGNKFAAELVSGSFTDAHALLSVALQKKYTKQGLAERYHKMIDYGHGPAKLDGYYLYEHDLPSLLPQDFGWVYISIKGEDYLEAVTVVVTQENGQPRIRAIEWGRP